MRKEKEAAVALEESERRRELAEKKLEAVMKQHKLQVEMLTGKLEDLKTK